MKRNILLALIALMLSSSPLSSATIKVEAETFTSYYDLEYELIRSAAGPSCSGGYMLVGLDYPNEWVKYEISVSSFGVYNANLMVRGDLNQPYSLRMEVTSNNINDNPQSVDFNFRGNGYG